MKSQLFRFPHAARRDPAVEAWLQRQSGELGEIARHWFEILRGCGDEVRECLHDGHPTACAADAAFAYVNVFKSHVNLGFFRGAELADPKQILEGSGKFMRHVKLGGGRACDGAALAKLIHEAYADMKARAQQDYSEGRTST